MNILISILLQRYRIRVWWLLSGIDTVQAPSLLIIIFRRRCHVIMRFGDIG